MKHSRLVCAALSLVLATSMVGVTGFADEAKPEYSYSMVMHNFGPLDEDPEMVKYWEKEYGVDFNMIYVEVASAAEQINLMISAGEIPDVLQMIDQNAYYEQGILGGWSEDFFREHAPKLSANIDNTNPNAWNYAKFDGENMYSIPGFRMYNSVASPVMWRTDWLNNVGISEIPETLEDVEKAFYAFANDDPDQNGQKDTYAISNTALASIYGAYGFQRGMWLEDGNGGVVFGDVMSGAKDALAKLNQWYKDGVLDPEFITGENQGGYWAISHAFINNRIGVSGMGSFYHWVDCTKYEGGDQIGAMAKAWQEAGQTGTYAPGKPPVGPDGKSGTVKYNTATLRTTFSANLVEDTERFARLLEIIDDLNCSSVEKSAMASRGMPGVHHEIKEWNGVQSLSIIVDNVGGILNKIGGSNWFAFIEECGNYDFQKVAYAQDFYWFDHEMADKNQGYVNAIFGALPSQSLYKTECDKILSEGYIAIITGDKPIEYFDEMVSAWYAAGGETLTKEANELFVKQNGTNT